MQRASRVKKPPRWQKGRTTIDLVLPSHATNPDKKKTVRFRLAWEAKATRPKTEREWVQWEMEQARYALERARSVLRSRRYVWPDLSSALNHAVRAWVSVHLHRKDVSDDDYREAFVARAPAALTRRYWKAISALSRLGYGVVTPSKVHSVVNSAVEGILEEAAHSLGTR